MRREIFLKGREGRALIMTIVHLLLMAFLLATVAPVAFFVTSCTGFTFTDEDAHSGKGELALSFTKVNAITKTTALSARTFPDSNSFMLRIQRVGGDIIYNGKYGERPSSFKLAPGSYDVEVFSNNFSLPEFDSPSYGDSGTVVIEENKVTTLSFMCRQSNGAVKLGFTPAFLARFAGHVPEIEDSKGYKVYPYSEDRFLYLNPGDVVIKLRDPDAASGSGLFIITRKRLSAREMVTVNLHSSSGESGGGGGPGGESSVITGIQIDTTSVWISEDIVVGDKRDGSSRERAVTVDEIAGFVGAKGIWVSGYVAGYLTTASLISSPPFENETNIAIAPFSGSVNRSLCAGVSLSAGGVRDALNLKTNPANLGKRIWIKGSIVESYFGLKGVNSVTDYVIE